LAEVRARRLEQQEKIRINQCAPRVVSDTVYIKISEPAEPVRENAPPGSAPFQLRETYEAIPAAERAAYFDGHEGHRAYQPGGRIKIVLDEGSASPPGAYMPLAPELIDKTVDSMLQQARDHTELRVFNRRARSPSEQLAICRPNWVRDQGLPETFAHEVCGWAASDQLCRYMTKFSTERSRSHRARRRAALMEVMDVVGDV
jgi:hypothetical protein